MTLLGLGSTFEHPLLDFDVLLVLWRVPKLDRTGTGDSSGTILQFTLKL